MDQHANAAFVEEKLACIRQDILYHDYIKNVPVDQYCAAVDEAAFEHVSKLPLPDDVRQELNALAPADYKLCLLPSIQQACAIIDTSVLFWNYNTGDVFRLSSAQRIHHVDIIRPAESPNGVSAATPFALVVTGDKEINVYGILSASERLDLAPKPWWRANSLDTILQVTQSHNGRIFMLGSIGHIFELVIGASTLAQLVCRTTQGFLQYYLSSYILKAPTIKYKLLAVDRERKIMYTLSDNSTIQVACLDDSPGTFSLLPPITNISDMLSDYLKERLPDSHGLPHKAITSILGTILRPRPLILVSLHVIPEETPNGIVLCAITSQGCRLYFSKTAQGALTSTTSLKLASVRIPPLNSMTNMSIMTSFCDQRGVILAEQQRLWLTKYFMVEKDKNASVQEAICDYAPEGRVFAIQLKEDNTDQNQFFDSMSQEKLRSNRQFHVLCSDGLHVYASLQPLAMIEKTLRKTDMPLDAIKGHQRCFGELATDAIIVKLLAADQDLAAQHQRTWLISVFSSFVHTHNGARVQRLLIKRPFFLTRAPADHGRRTPVCCDRSRACQLFQRGQEALEIAYFDVSQMAFCLCAYGEKKRQSATGIDVFFFLK
ncbi:Nup133 N terminal like-domain-containing protein [Gongronella butleri]|nr:Nup133 N terminal like-domain-containing protein [Gongronella butleri]